VAVCLAEQPVRPGGKFLRPEAMLWSGHRCSTCLIVLALGVIPRRSPVTSPTGHAATATVPGTGGSG
jgi:hypothetical protein